MKPLGEYRNFKEIEDTITSLEEELKETKAAHKELLKNYQGLLNPHRDDKDGIKYEASYTFKESGVDDRWHVVYGTPGAINVLANQLRTLDEMVDRLRDKFMGQMK